MRTLSIITLAVACVAVAPGCGGDGKKNDEKKQQEANPFDPASRMNSNMTEAEKKQVQEANKQVFGE